MVDVKRVRSDIILESVSFMLERFQQRIREKSEHVDAAPVLIIPFGDSVTQGCMEANVIDHAGVYHNQLKRKLEAEYPQTTFSVINAGVSGASAESSLARLERDVIRHNPDLVILGFCLNDACAGLEKLDCFEQNIRRMVREIRENTAADMIILTPNFMASVETSRIAEVHKPYAATIIACQNRGVLKVYVERLRELASELEIPLADVYAEWEKLHAAGVDTTALLSNGLNHPDAERQQLIAKTIFTLIPQARPEN